MEDIATFESETMAINWIAAYNRLFEILNTSGETYFSGPKFLDVVREVDPNVPYYSQLIKSLRRRNRSTSRRDYYEDLIMNYDEPTRIKIFGVFLKLVEAHEPQKVGEIRKLISEEAGGPKTIVRNDIWNVDRLREFLEKMDTAITAHEYNRSVTLAYSCLEGFYKAFIRKKIPRSTDVTDLISMAREVKNYLRGSLSSSGVFPEQVINLIPSVTHAVAYSRNRFSESHFDGSAEPWLAVFARDCVNSIGRLLLQLM